MYVIVVDLARRSTGILSLHHLFVQNQSHSVYINNAFASPGHNCSQPLEHRKKQLTKETHFVSETGLAKLKVRIRTLWPL